jgi:hypothetical protein
MNDSLTLKQPLSHFDVFGPLDHVLRAIDIHVPVIFADEAPHFIDSLKEVIKKHAATNNWQSMALSLSKGLARVELDALLEKEVPHVGAIIIDPTAHTPEHEVFKKPSLIDARKERLISLNEATNDVLIIFYGLETAQSDVERLLLMKRMRVLEQTLDAIDDANSDLRQVTGFKNRPLSMHAFRKLQTAKRHFKNAYHKMGQGHESQIDLDNDDQNADLFITLVALQNLIQNVNDPATLQTLQGLLHQIQSMPYIFENSGVNFAAFEDTANTIMQNRSSVTLAPDVRLDGDAHMQNRAQFRPTPVPR